MDNIKKKSNAGRKSKYESNVLPKLDLIKHWARDGLTDKEMCERLRISQDSFYLYKNQYPQFSDVLKESKEIADNQVVDSLFRRANGYTYTEHKRYVNKDGDVEITDTIKEVAPDTTAQIFWLKNRDKLRWRDKQEIDLNAKVEVIEIKLPEDLKPDED